LNSNIACKVIGDSWKLGNSFPYLVNSPKEIAVPLYAGKKKMRFWKDVNGVIVYTLIDNVSPKLEFEPVPEYSPVPDKYWLFFKTLMKLAMD
jgi:hypothetical protein